MSTVDTIVKEIKSFGDAKYALHHYKFFKCDGGYGDPKDQFCGIRAPDMGRLVKKHWKDVAYENLKKLIVHKVHEVRTFVLAVLVEKYGRTDETEREKIVKFYLAHTNHINNWDLVDISCYKILGRWCFDQGDYSILEKLSRSKNLWEQRIAMVSTYWPTHRGNFKPVLGLAEKFLSHSHDLIHKASGWMLREVGKQGEAGYKMLVKFLDKHSGSMPRTMLRYAIERFEPELRRHYMGK